MVSDGSCNWCSSTYALAPLMARSSTVSPGRVWACPPAVHARTRQSAMEISSLTGFIGFTSFGDAAIRFHSRRVPSSASNTSTPFGSKSKTMPSPTLEGPFAPIFRHQLGRAAVIEKDQRLVAQRFGQLNAACGALRTQQDVLGTDAEADVPAHGSARARRRQARGDQDFLTESAGRWPAQMRPAMRFMVGMPKKPATKRLAGRR